MVAVECVLVEDWMVHGGGALLRGSVHRGCVVRGRVVDQIVGHSALQRGGQPWSGGQMMAGGRQHDVMKEMNRRMVKHFLIMLMIEGGEAGIGTAIKAARSRVGAGEV